jgi:glutamate dehydrogenase
VVYSSLVGNVAAGAAAVEIWVKPCAGEVERIHTAVNEIAASGLTLSKLSVAARLHGDLVRDKGGRAAQFFKGLTRRRD